MEKLAAEIARKRKLINEVAVAKSGDGLTDHFRFVRQKDIQQHELQSKLDQLRQIEEKNRTTNVEMAAKMNNSRPTESSQPVAKKRSVDVEKNLVDSLSRQQIIRKLRELGQPITLFGETEDDRKMRLLLEYRKTTEAVSNLGDEEEYRLDSRKGFSNVSNQARVHRNRSASFDFDEDAESASNKNSNSKDGINSNSSSADNEQRSHSYSHDQQQTTRNSNQKNNDDDNDNDSGEDDKDGEGAHARNSDIDRFSKQATLMGVEFSRTPGITPEKIIYKYFRTVLKMWEYDLEKRSDHEKHSAAGKKETRTQKQCKDYIRPLFKLCKKKQLPFDIMDQLLKLVICCEQGNFKGAHDHYWQCAIGNAAWPIGLTMVGIHERSGRERISTAKVAHIMNNELQRKYLSSVKRLMTFAQIKRPDVPPSMKVL